MLLEILIIAIGLSMDAFSLAILYGTLGLKKKTIYTLSIIVGIFHFMMPLLGYLLGDLFLAKLLPEPRLLVGCIFLMLSLQMLYSLKKEEEITLLTGMISLLLFGFTVSLDSFSVGLGLGAMMYSLPLCCVMFSLASALFTFLGLKIGTNFSNHFGKWATVFGGVLLLGLSISYFFYA